MVGRGVLKVDDDFVMMRDAQLSLWNQHHSLPVYSDSYLLVSSRGELGRHQQEIPVVHRHGLDSWSSCQQGACGMHGVRNGKAQLLRCSPNQAVPAAIVLLLKVGLACTMKVLHCGGSQNFGQWRVLDIRNYPQEVESCVHIAMGTATRDLGSTLDGASISRRNLSLSPLWAEGRSEQQEQQRGLPSNGSPAQ
jgi:hypothetical protein